MLDSALVTDAVSPFGGVELSICACVRVTMHNALFIKNECMYIRHMCAWERVHTHTTSLFEEKCVQMEGQRFF